MYKYAFYIIGLILVILTGCSNPTTTNSDSNSNHIGSAITVAFVDVNKTRYVVTTERVSSVGKEINSNQNSSDKNEYVEVPGQDPQNFIALKEKDVYVKAINIKLWCETDEVKESKDLKKAGNCHS